MTPAISVDYSSKYSLMYKHVYNLQAAWQDFLQVLEQFLSTVKMLDMTVNNTVYPKNL